MKIFNQLWNSSFSKIIALIVASATTGQQHVSAQTAGTLDPSFGGTGYVTAVGVSTYRGAQGMAIQPDGRILVVTSNSVMRWNPDGSLDGTFGVNGRLMINLGPNTGGASSIVLQGDGKMLITGEGEGFPLLRLNSDGTTDSSFNGTGLGQKPPFTFGGIADQGTCIGLQADGRIVVGGSAYVNAARSDDFAIARWNPDGTLDTTFGVGGKSVISSGSSSNRAYSLAIAADQKIVMTGHGGSSGNHARIALCRLLPTGALDGTFGSSGGFSTIQIGSGNVDEVGRAVAIQPDGKIVVGGYYYGTGSSDMPKYAAARFNQNGSLDTSFSGDGIQTIVVGLRGGWGYCMSLQGDGKIVIGGHSSAASSEAFGILRLNSNGSPDTSFNGTGQAVVPVAGAGYAFATAMAFQTDGKIVAIGPSGDQSPSNITVMRFHSALLQAGLLVRDQSGAVIVDNATIVPFQPNLLAQTTRRVLTLTNSGQAIVMIQGLSVSGADAAEFTFNSLSTSNLSAGQSVDLLISHTATSAGIKSAVLRISNSLSGTLNPFDIHVSARGLAPTEDDDNDGLKNSEEVGLAALGLPLDPTRSDSNYLGQLRNLGLYRSSDMLNLRPTPALELVPGTNTVKILIGVQQSSDLLNFTPLLLNEAGGSITSDGKFKFEFTAPENIRFFRLSD